MAGDKNKLTEKQRQILEYLKQEILQRGFPMKKEIKSDEENV